MRALVIGAVVVVTTSAASAKPGAIVVPPAEIEVGAASPIGAAADSQRGVGTATEFRVGFHWASMYWKPTPIDFGIGFVASTRQSFIAPTSERTLGSDEPGLSLKGAYVSGAYAIENHKHWRTWLGARLEMLSGSNNGERVTTTGVAVRLATELYSASVAGVADNHVAAFFAGAWALGVYVEGLHRGIPGDITEIDAAAGVTMRIPFIAGVAD